MGHLTDRIAHELNNPLTAVLGFAELIAQTATEARVREDARMIVAEALRMREIIQDLIRPEVLTTEGSGLSGVGSGDHLRPPSPYLFPLKI